jgi:subtilisin family serine protease
MDVTVWYPTRWLNGALIETDSSKLSEIRDLPFVNNIEYVAPGPLRPQNIGQIQQKNAVLANGRVQSTELQNHLLGVDHMVLDGNTGAGIIIGVFDGGFQGVDQVSSFSHFTTNDQLKAAFDFVGNSPNVFRYDDHGTKALSVLGGNTPGLFTGSAVDADYILSVTEDVSSEYRIEEYNWLFAAEMADSVGVDIITTSLGYSDFDDSAMNYQPEDLDGTTTAISRAGTIAASKGIVLIFSAGNEGNSSWRTITAPADVKDAIAVGAIRNDSTKASFSSTGPTADGRIKPDVVALGVNTAVINRNGNVVFNNGTSFSGPQIAGLAAGVWQANPEYTYLEVIEAIRDSSHMLQDPNNQTGYGIPFYPNAKKLVLSVESSEDAQFIQLFPNPMGDHLYLLSQTSLRETSIFIHNTSGQALFENRLSYVSANTPYRIDIPNLASGVYLVTVLAPEGAETFRLIRE